ncbi:MAG: hypothetical protein ACRC6T_17335 [Sarcina sp.]
MESIKFGGKSDGHKNILSILGIFVVVFLYLAWKCLVSPASYTSNFLTSNFLGYLFLLGGAFTFILFIRIFMFFKNGYQHEFTDKGMFFRGPFTKETFISWDEIKSYHIVAIRDVMPAIMLYVKDKDAYEKRLNFLSKKTFNYNSRRGNGEIGFIYTNMNGKYDLILDFIKSKVPKA